MTNNDILRRIRYIFDYNDDTMMHIFALVEREVSREKLSNWLKKEDNPDFEGIYDKDLACFLNGLIIYYRGKKDDEIPKPEKTLTNNLIFNKLRIALQLKSEDILEILLLADLKISKHELSAFFRKPHQSQYRLCKDQVLRNFLYGLQRKHRLDAPKEPI